LTAANALPTAFLLAALFVACGFASMSLHQFGFTGRVPKRAADNGADADGSNEPSSSKKLAEDSDRSLSALCEDKIESRKLSFPWAVYEGPVGSAHTWSCATCDSRKGASRSCFKFKDSHDFRKHEKTAQHKQAAESQHMAAGFTKVRNSMVSECYKHDLNAAGRMLIIVAFMVANGISLCLFPQVRLLL
jgi:hypothetical protein